MRTELKTLEYQKRTLALHNKLIFTGQISMEEFEEVIQLLVKQQNMNCPLDQISDIARSIDLNHDGRIDFNEFLEAFRIVDSFGKFSEVQQHDLKSISSLDSIMTMKNCSFSMGTKRRISNLDDIKEYRPWARQSVLTYRVSKLSCFGILFFNIIFGCMKSDIDMFLNIYIYTFCNFLHFKGIIILVLYFSEEYCKSKDCLP